MKGPRGHQKTEDKLLRAQVEFIADPARRSVEFWYERLLVRLMPIDRVRRYALENHWAEKRQAFWKGVEAAWLKQHETHLIQKRITEMHELEELRGQAYQLIRPRKGPDGVLRFPVQPKSWEGVVRSFVTLDDSVETKRAAILNELEPMLAAREEEPEVEGRSILPFSPDEMRHLARDLLSMRRKRRHLELGIEDDEDDDDDEEPETEARPEGDMAGSDPGGGGLAG